MEPPDLTLAKPDRPTILIYAREHATEPDGSWVVEGIFRWLISDDPAAHLARQQYDWLLISLLDPDRAAEARYTDADLFTSAPPVRPEVIAYATYLVNWVDAGHRIAIAVNLHNVECTEGPHLFSPLINQSREEAIQSFHRQWLYPAIEKAGFVTGQPAWSTVGLANFRLSGWCAMVFHTLDLFYEVNGRAPSARLMPPQLADLGQLLAQHSLTVINTAAMAAMRTEMREALATRERERAAYWQQHGRTADTRTPGDLLVLGY
jgi:hypothetical protein